MGVDTGGRGLPGTAAGAQADCYAAARLRLLRGEDGTAAGAPRRAELARLTDRWLTGLLGDAREGFAVVAVGGYGRGELSPRSDLDLLLLHDGTAGPSGVAEVADRLWYPVWDLGLALDHSVRTPAEARETAAEDLKVQLGLLDARHVAGDERLTAGLRSEVLAQWRSQAPRRLPELRELAEERARARGELRFLLEPDLKEARGGLRDATALRAIAASWLADAPRSGLEQARQSLLDVRDRLHLSTGRATDRLALQDQDEVAEALGLADGDALLRRVYEAARTVAYAADVTWREVGRVLNSRRGRATRRGAGEAGGGRERAPLADGIVEHEGEAVLARSARPARDAVLPLRAAAAAAQSGLPLASATVRSLAAAPALPVPWPAEAREEFVTLLGAGEATVQAWEALDAEGIVGRLLPDWQRVRCRPQRNPVHRFTVDRHLVETAVRASALTRRVQRPDLLLIGALLHDIGKGRPGDHSEAGAVIAHDTAARMGFSARDADVLAALVRHHLLLVETATRRDLDDPATVRRVAGLVGSAGTLELLHALTEADALATGPAAWSAWRAALVDDLVKRVAAALAGETAEEHAGRWEPSPEAERLAAEAWRSGGPALALRAPGADPRPGAELLVALPEPCAPGRHPEPPVPARHPERSPAGGEGANGGQATRGHALGGQVAGGHAIGALPAVAGVLAMHRTTVRAADLRLLRPPELQRAPAGAPAGEGPGGRPDGESAGDSGGPGDLADRGDLSGPADQGEERARETDHGTDGETDRAEAVPAPGDGAVGRSAAGAPGDSGGAAAVLLLSWRVAAEYGSLPSAQRLRADLVRALDGSLDIAERLAEREAAHRGPRRRRAGQAPPPRATVAPGGSESATVLEVRAPDAPGLLYRIGRALERAGVLVRSAHVSTLGADAVDAFYVTGTDGLPLQPSDAAGLAGELERELRGSPPDGA